MWTAFSGQKVLDIAHGYASGLFSPAALSTCLSLGLATNTSGIGQVKYFFLSFSIFLFYHTKVIVQLASKIEANVKKAVVLVCEERGIKMSRFIEDALIDRLEELVDREELPRLRREPTRPLAAVLKDLKVRGKL